MTSLLSPSAASSPSSKTFLADRYPEVPETIARDKTLAPRGTVDALKKAIADFKAQFKP